MLSNNHEKADRFQEAVRLPFIAVKFSPAVIFLS
jgi:hypothetical protein